MSRLIPYVTLLLVWLALATSAFGQSPPVDLPDLSLAELLQVEMGPEDGEHLGTGKTGLRFDYQYTRIVFDGFRDGTTKISPESLLASAPPPPPPPAGKYVVVQTRIVQEAHTFIFAYDPAERVTLTLLIPYIRQSTDHIGIVPGYTNFTISNEGVGDIAVGGSYEIWSGRGQLFEMNAALSFPSGSIEKKDDTPRPPVGGDEQLPYTMQLGSGTWDIILGAHYQGARRTSGWLGFLREIGWGIGIDGKIRTGRNMRDYRLGNVLFTSAWTQVAPITWLRPKAGLTAQIWGRITGEDVDLRIPDPSGFIPTPVADPALFGGEKLLIELGVDLDVPQSLLRRMKASEGVRKAFAGVTFDVTGGIPIYQRLNGPQPQQDWQIKTGISWHF